MNSVTRSRQLIALLSLGNFMIGMGAFVVVGVLPLVATHYAISASQAGYMMTSYAIAYTLASPLCVALSGQYSRRNVLVTGFLLFAAGSLLTAMASSAQMLNIARVVTALGAGMVTPVAAAVALAAAPPAEQGRALAAVFFGLTLAQVIGVPAGSFIGFTFGWQLVFVLVGVLSIVMCIGVAVMVPRSLPFQVNTLGTLRDALLDYRSLFSVLFTATFIAAFYVLYTFLAAVLAESMGYGRDGITLTLIVFGVGAVAGNMLGGMLTDSIGSFRTLLIGCASQVVFMPMFSLLPMNDILFLCMTFVWSLLGWSFMAAQQTRLVALTPQRQNVVLALNAASIYLGASLGSVVGGIIVDSHGLSMLGYGAAVCGILGVVHLLLSERLNATSRVGVA